jgi:RNA polymerase sigma factor (TIGR02999 family)
MAEITQILERTREGEPAAVEALFELVYGELKRLAAAKMLHEIPGQTLQPTALVHEAWLRMGGDVQPTWENRAHFFGAASEAMRRILVERARRRQAAKRGSGEVPVELDALDIQALPEDDDAILRVNDVLERFALVDPRKAELVKLRYFVGLSFEETASALNIAVPTAKQWWAYARAWLSVELRKDREKT